MNIIFAPSFRSFLMTEAIENKPSKEACQCCNNQFTDLLTEFKNSKVQELSEIGRFKKLDYDTLGLVLEFEADIYPIHITVSHQRKSHFRPPHLDEDPKRWDGPEIYTYQEFVDFYGETADEVWEEAIPELEREVKKWDGDELYTREEFEDHYGDLANERWEEAEEDEDFTDSDWYDVHYGEMYGYCWHEINEVCVRCFKRGLFRSLKRNNKLPFLRSDIGYFLNPKRDEEDDKEVEEKFQNYILPAHYNITFYRSQQIRRVGNFHRITSS